MKTLHNINSVKLTDEELSVLYYGQRHPAVGYKFRINWGSVQWRYADYPYSTKDWKSINGWNTFVTLRDWIEAGRPMPDLTSIPRTREP